MTELKPGTVCDKRPRIKMTVSEFYVGCECRSTLKVLSARTGKVMAHRFDPQKHEEIGKKQICAIWAELSVTDSGFGNYCRPIMCCYAMEG